MTKLFKLLLILTVITTIFACGKDDDTGPATLNPADNLFIGTWNLVAFTASFSTVSEFDTLTSTVTATNITYSTTYEADNYSRVGDYDFIEVARENEFEETFNSNTGDLSESGTYSFDGTTITFIKTSGNTPETSASPYEIDANGDMKMDFDQSFTDGDVRISQSIRSLWVRQ